MVVTSAVGIAPSEDAADVGQSAAKPPASGLTLVTEPGGLSSCVLEARLSGEDGVGS